MVLERIQAMLTSCATDSPLFPPTLLYNESWLLRLVLDGFSTSLVGDHPLRVPEGGRWFSEALLPSAFLTRWKGDALAEAWTHADAVMGHFEVGLEGKTDLQLADGATHFVVLEAKLFSGLSSGVKYAAYFDQAARSVACIAEVLNRARRSPQSMSHLGFYVLAPRSQIEKGVFAELLSRDSIRQKVNRRVAAYEGAKAEWYSDWFEPTLQRVDIRSMSWEQVIGVVRQNGGACADSIGAFYERCIEFNHQVPTGVLA